MVARLILVCILLAGCQTSKAGFCSIAKPIRLSPAAVEGLSDQEVAAILTHNEKGAALCGWKP